MNIRSIIYLISRLVVGSVFIYASLDKIAHPAAFAEIIYYYKILPTGLVNPAALILPWVELVAGVLLIIGRPAFPAATVLLSLVLVFIGAIGFNLARGLDFHCGCFSTSESSKSAGYNTLIRDIFLTIPALICMFESWRRLKQKQRSDSRKKPGLL